MLSVSFLFEYSDAEFGHSRKITDRQIELEILEKWKTKFSMASTFYVPVLKQFYEMQIFDWKMVEFFKYCYIGWYFVAVWD